MFKNKRNDTQIYVLWVLPLKAFKLPILSIVILTLLLLVYLLNQLETAIKLPWTYFHEKSKRGPWKVGAFDTKKPNRLH